MFLHVMSLGIRRGIVLPIEMMGRHSNLFLVNQEDNTIIDCVKRVSLGQNSYRTLQPGARLCDATSNAEEESF